MKIVFWRWILTFGILLNVQPTFAQNISKQSYEKAREVLDKSIAAYGGLENLRSIRNFTIKASGDMVLRNQGRRPFFSHRAPFQIEITVDPKNNRFNQIQQGGFPGGSTYRDGFAVDKADGVSFDLIRGTSEPVPNVSPVLLRQHLRQLPQFWILSVIERASGLRYLGRTDFDKRPHDVLSYANEEGQETTLYFDEKTNLLSKSEMLGTDVFAGDVVLETIFTGYRNETNQQIPTGRITKIGDELTEEIRYEQISFNTNLTDDKFKVPNNLRAVTNPTPQPVTKLGENVYTVNQGGYNVLFVAFKDHVLVMDAPGGDTGSREVTEQIKKTVPNKPIRYVAITHHHDDHAGGFRTYAAEGATLIVAPGEKSFFEKAAKAKFTISPDTLALNPRPLKIATVESDKRVFTDGTSTVEIYNIGSNPHTDEMLVAYLPNEKILFQADLLNRPPNGDQPIATDGSVYLAKWIDTRRLAVERIILVHGTVTTMDELRQSVLEKEKARQ